VVPVSANGSPAFAHYRSTSLGSAPTALAIHVLDIVDGQISGFHAFIDAALFEVFGLPLEPVSS
jgi:RNA polymerase sigma-70 factor (ECF subfamily)